MLDLVTRAWAPSGYPMQYTDVGGAPPDIQTPWARVILRHVSGGQASLAGADGTSRWYNQGTLFVQVFAPVGDGSTAAYDAAQIILDALRGARAGAVWFRNPRINEVGTSGAFEQVNVISEFTYDAIR